MKWTKEEVEAAANTVYNGPEWESTDAGEIILGRFAVELACQRNALRDALKGLLLKVDVCEHTDAHREGAIWTICDDCGRQWADDEGGFKPYKEPKQLTDALAALAKTETK